jgi:cytochrome c oxidase subunit 2
LALVLFACSACGIKEDRKNASEGGLSGSVMRNVRWVQIKASKTAFEPNRVLVRKGDPARLEVVSSDADGSFTIPSLKVAAKVVPGKTSLVDLTPGKQGEFAFYLKAGPGSSEVKGTLAVVP